MDTLTDAEIKAACWLQAARETGFSTGDAFRARLAELLAKGQG